MLKFGRLRTICHILNVRSTTKICRKNKIKSFDNLNKPEIGKWFNMPYSSVILQFTTNGYDSFHLRYECRRYFMKSDNTLEVFAGYSDFDESGSHCFRRGMIPGKIRNLCYGVI